jgi:hypothetical protein
MPVRRLFITFMFAALVIPGAVGAAQTPAQTPPPAPTPAPAAPTALTPADAAALLGDWTIAAESPNGAASWLLTLKVADAKVVGEISSETTARTSVTDITKRGASVVLRYSFDYQGTPVPTSITLTPAGETLTVVFDFADGAFTMNGKATKKK